MLTAVCTISHISLVFYIGVNVTHLGAVGHDEAVDPGGCDETGYHGCVGFGGLGCAGCGGLGCAGCGGHFPHSGVGEAAAQGLNPNPWPRPPGTVTTTPPWIADVVVLPPSLPAH